MATEVSNQTTDRFSSSTLAQDYMELVERSGPIFTLDYLMFQAHVNVQ